MIKTAIGLILLLIPFLLIHKFKNKQIGFAYISCFLLAFHLILPLLLQSLRIFKYLLVLGINILIIIIISRKLNFKHLFQSIKNLDIKGINWTLIFIIIILFIQLYSIHYNYSGDISTIKGFSKVSNMKYPYPYFSDEWSAVSMIQYSTSSGRLPIVNPLWGNSPCLNFELPFHSFVSEIILLLNLNPLTQYTILTIFSGILICVLVYLILRVNKINKLASSVACLSVPYIVNGANLPGIWNLMPLTLGIISLLIGLFFISSNNKKMSLFSSFLTLIFYPPLFVIHSIALIFYFVFSKTSKKQKIKLILLYLIICAIVAILLFTFVFFVRGSFKRTLEFTQTNLFYSTFTTNAIPDFTIWKIIPIPILLLSALGIIKTFKKKIWLVSPIIVGLIFWVVYSRTTSRLIIEYARIVVTTSILIVILSGFGLHYLIGYLEKIEDVKKYRILKFIQVIVLLGFLILAFSYTERDNWKELKLYSVENDGIFIPAAPANQYLHEDDLKLFGNIKEKRFLSVPWKGTVIGVSTKNYPLLTKEATITNKLLDYNAFLKANCNEKSSIAQEKNIQYVYSQEFDCKNFEIKGISEEGLHLYEFIKE